MTELAARFRKMADAAEKDAEGFWPGAPLYALERRIAAETWLEALDLVLADEPLDAEARALKAEAVAAQLWADVPALATADMIRAATWRRIAKIQEKHDD